jgi:hypothetical protein
MIKRFEDEYPECRLPKPMPTAPTGTLSASPPSSIDADSTSLVSAERNESEVENPAVEPVISDEENHAKISRRASEVSLASRALSNEEGRMHRLGHIVRRDILRPQTPDNHHGTTGDEPEPEHLRVLRCKLENLEGDEIKDTVNKIGVDEMLRCIGDNAEELRIMLASDPEGFAKFKEAQAIMEQNQPASKAPVDVLVDAPTSEGTSEDST